MGNTIIVPVYISTIYGGILVNILLQVVLYCLNTCCVVFAWHITVTSIYQLINQLLLTLIKSDQELPDTITKYNTCDSLNESTKNVCQ